MKKLEYMIWLTKHKKKLAKEIEDNINEIKYTKKKYQEEVKKLREEEENEEGKD